MISEKEIEKALNNTIEGQRKLLIAEFEKMMTEIKPYFDKNVRWKIIY